MTIEVPSVEDFLDRYPEFEEADEDRIASALDEATSYVSDDWVSTQVPHAILSLAAHFVYTEIMTISSVEGAVSGEGTVAGPLIMETKSIGPLSISRRYKGAGTGNSSGSGAASDAAPSKDVPSPYLDRFNELLLRNFPPVLVVI